MPHSEPTKQTPYQFQWPGFTFDIGAGRSVNDESQSQVTLRASRLGNSPKHHVTLCHTQGNKVKRPK
ncbi:hypothetical protein CDV36_013360 [Fusarium kuroshium]|uniref:Uncharacterized protein n=1 Tax=Fusarium kuroshium TaxID=2010991 RepID=A0A3M2RQB7_9HYPO|nr:hypothetical protein CDV36_013360 [Fusarium kuroshium]